MPARRSALCAAVIGLVLGFRSSDRLASAYGIAVTGTMAITTVLFFFVARAVWRKRASLVIAGALGFLTVDLALFAASLTKLRHGGWLPVTVGLAVFTLFTTWRAGRRLVLREVLHEEGPLRRSSRTRAACARRSTARPARQSSSVTSTRRPRWR
jgi:KUP system potassium uptake protein